MKFIGIDEQFLVMYGKEQNKQSHCHYGIQLFIPLQTLNMNGTWVHSPIIIDSGIEHFVYSDGDTFSILFFPESPLGRKIKKYFFTQESIIELQNPKFVILVNQFLKQILNPPKRSALVTLIIDQLLSNIKITDSIDERIVQLIHFIYTSDVCHLTYNDVIEYLYFSKTHVARLFKEEIDIPIMKYLTWNRLLRATRHLTLNKQTITETAHQFGFADAAHFSRVFKENFGVSPRSALENMKYNDCLIHVFKSPTI